MRKRTVEQYRILINYCKKRLNKARKSTYINFWCFVAYDTMELLYQAGGYKCVQSK